MHSSELHYTPFTQLSTGKSKDVKEHKFVIGRADSKEMLCIGSFGTSVADVYDYGERVFLKINADGSAGEHYPDKSLHQTDVVKFTDDQGAIVMCKFGEYWLVPFGFNEWAKTVFPPLVKTSNQ